MWNHKSWPKVEYEQKYLSNIAVRVDLEEYFRRRITHFFPYQVIDFETPESLAQDFYGDPEDHWIIILANGIIDPFHDWPMDHVTFTEYLKKKYLPRAWADQDYHHYENPPGTVIPDPGTNELRDQYGITNFDYYLGQIHHYEDANGRLTPTGTEITNLQYEEKENDRKRQVRIIKLNHLPLMKKELTQILEAFSP